MNFQTGRDALSQWFGLSYASFLTLPRVLMEAMPDEWQWKMAMLLEEYDDEFPNKPRIGSRVMATKEGKLIPMPSWLKNYRRPDETEIARLRGES